MKKTLVEVMPELSKSDHSKIKAHKMKHIVVIAEHGDLCDENPIPWVGKHKNVYFWVELENGYAVGLNENPSNGWSFPVIKMESV